MIENSIEEFSKDLIQFLTGQSKISRTLLVKKHSERLQTQGDFSFPNSLKSWYEYFLNFSSQDSDKSLLDYVHKETSNLIEESKNWHLEVMKTVAENDRIHLFLDRPKAIAITLKQAVNNNNTIAAKLQTQFNSNNENVSCDNGSEETYCLTSLRVKYLKKSTENLYSTLTDHRKLPKIVLTSKSSYKSVNGLTMLCGAVLNIKTGGKETNIKADDYLRMRQNEMTLIAQHKYGVRVATDDKCKEFVAHLGESAVKFELLQTKPGSAVKVNFDCSSAGSSKGAAFILYNCARLEAIFRTYNTKVAEGTYPSLPDIEDTDLSSLTQEDEWTLIFNYILGFPSLLESCVVINESSCDFRQHHICNFLCSMVRVFSQYYRKTRILTEPRKHLLPVMFARLHMLKILNDTLKLCLTILDIKSISQMYYIVLFI